MSKKVMIVDDDKSIVELVQIVLKRKGYEVYGAFGGEECIKSIGGINPDILIMDVMMPDMNGWEVLKKLKEDGILEHIKVIMLTVVKEPFEEYSDLSPYVLDYITKPCSNEDILEGVKRLSEL
ncbi:response regulator [archaeon]|nr:response regulator [archaeon]